ncbi:MAG: sodium:solute symporter family protein [Candidatus Peregrinibacteria bacterium]
MLDTYLIIGYIVICVLIGYFSGRRQMSGDYVNMDRKLGLFSFVCAVVASLIGATAMVVFVAYIFQFGIGALSAILGVAIGFTVFAFYAHRLRQLAHEHQFNSMADFFHHSFGGSVGRFVALLVLLELIILILKQFIGGVGVIIGISSYSYETGLLLSASVVLTYLLMGGFRSMIRTDIFQYLAMLVLMFVIGFSMAGRADLPVSALLQNNSTWGTAISFFVLGLVIVWYDPATWQRIYAAKNDRVVRWGLIYSSIALIILGIGMTLIALSARQAFPDIDPSQALVFGITHLLPSGLVGLGAILIFAAILSTADTLLFLIASNITKDFIGPLKKRDLSSNELVYYTRWSLIITIILVASLAYFFRDIVKLALISDAIGMALAPAIIASFFIHLKSRAVAISIASGVIYTFAWVTLGNTSPETMISAIVPSAITLLIFQRLLKAT